MNEDQIFEQAFNDESITDAPASVEQPLVETSQESAEVEVAPIEQPVADVQPEAQQASESQQPKHWIDLVPDEARKELDPILQDWRSNHGRVSALTKKTLEQEALIAELQAKVNESQAPKQEAPEANEPNPLDALKEEFPELGNSIERALAHEREQMQRTFEQKLTPLEQMRLENEQRAYALQRQQGLAQVAQAHPDWQQIVNAPVFKSWFDQQPAAVQNILTDSENPSENIWLLSQFKRDMALANQQRQVQSQAKSQRLAQSAGVKQTGKPVGESDPDALFAYAYQNA
ncbi:MAG: hypothetical protein M1579_03110 [Gammaproteobacteria bacterium]|nr:hypothetical protein [Gammaproteobacteria bacterium]